MDEGDAELVEAEAALARGEVVGIPTDTVYGLAVRFGDAAAFGRLAAVKGREPTKATAVLVGGEAGASELAELDERARRLIRAFWPGGLTLVVRRRPEVAAEVGGDDATIGIRHAASAVVDRLIGAVGPLVTSSANRAGEPALLDSTAVRAELGDRLGAVVEGVAPGGTASTVVDCTGDELRILRVGAIGEAELRAAGRAPL